MIVPVAALVALLLPALAGGRLRRLGTIRIRMSGLLFGALLLQVAVVELPGSAPKPVLAAGHVVTYVAAGVVIWANRRLPGVLLIGLGAATNGLTIAVNGGELPASAAALRAAGLPVHAAGFANSTTLAHPRLSLFGDVFAIPAGWPLANVFSVGDVLIVLGVAVLSYRVSRTVSRTIAPESARASVPQQRPARMLQQAGDLGQEPAAQVAVDDPVVEAQRQL